ncbi:hypothetical protein MUP32_06450 [Candidatus Microgenomates bacterium]|nr:hypothetical protein [Candidatus Microgenomates bacterium]
MNSATVHPKLTAEEIKQLVIERLRRIPAGKKVSIGADGDFTSDELIKLVEKNDKIGDKIIEMQLEYLRSLKNLLNQ